MEAMQIEGIVQSRIHDEDSRVFRVVGEGTPTFEGLF